MPLCTDIALGQRMIKKNAPLPQADSVPTIGTADNSLPAHDNSKPF
jgi:hypothetical protein